MRIGFHLRYRKCDNVFAAIRLADLFSGLGHEVSLLNTAPRVPKVSAVWDKKVVCGGGNLNEFRAWVKNYDVVVWPEPPPLVFFDVAQSDLRRTILLAPWDSLDRESGEVYSRADILVAPCRAAAGLYKKWGLTNVYYVPWDPGIPLTRKGTRKNGKVRVLFPLYGDDAAKADDHVLSMLWEFLDSNEGVEVTILLRSSSIDPVGHSFLKRMRRNFKSRNVSILRESGFYYEDLPYLYGKHDITSWISIVDGFGLVGLISLSMGVPVVAYDIPPQNEFIENKKNSILVSCDVGKDDIGVQYARPNPQEFGAALEKASKDRSLLAHMKSFSHSGLASRKYKFEKTWKKLISS